MKTKKIGFNEKLFNRQRSIFPLASARVVPHADGREDENVVK